MPKEQVKVFLTTPDALLFKDFQQFHQTFALLCETGVFDIKSGSAIIHFDKDSNIKKIERHDNLFDSRIKSML